MNPQEGTKDVWAMNRSIFTTALLLVFGIGFVNEQSVFASMSEPVKSLIRLNCQEVAKEYPHVLGANLFESPPTLLTEKFGDRVFPLFPTQTRFWFFLMTINRSSLTQGEPYSQDQIEYGKYAEIIKDLNKVYKFLMKNKAIIHNPREYLIRHVNCFPKNSETIEEGVEFIRFVFDTMEDTFLKYSEELIATNPSLDPSQMIPQPTTDNFSTIPAEVLNGVIAPIVGSNAFVRLSVTSHQFNNASIQVINRNTKAELVKARLSDVVQKGNVKSRNTILKMLLEMSEEEPENVGLRKVLQDFLAEENRLKYLLTESNIDADLHFQLVQEAYNKSPADLEDNPQLLKVAFQKDKIKSLEFLAYHLPKRFLNFKKETLNQTLEEPLSHLAVIEGRMDVIELLNSAYPESLSLDSIGLDNKTLMEKVLVREFSQFLEFIVLNRPELLNSDGAQIEMSKYLGVSYWQQPEPPVAIFQFAHRYMPESFYKEDSRYLLPAHSAAYSKNWKTLLHIARVEPASLRLNVEKKMLDPDFGVRWNGLWVTHLDQNWGPMDLARRTGTRAPCPPAILEELEKIILDAPCPNTKDGFLPENCIVL